MSKLMDERLAEVAKMKAYQFALKLLARDKLTFEEIAEICELTLEEVKELAEENNIVTV